MRQGERIDVFVPHDPRTGRPHGYASTVQDSADILQSASFAVIVENLGPFSGGPGAVLAAAPDALERSLFGYGEEWFAVGACVENMWLAAISLGLAGAFLADVTIAEDEWKPILGLTGELIGALALGYSDEVPGARCDEPYQPEMERVVWHGDLTETAD